MARVRAIAVSIAIAIAIAIATGAAVGFSASPAHAQAPDLVTDRPDQTESAETVPPGHVQVEIGYLVTEDEEGGVRVETEEAPGTLVRIGLIEDLELRLGWSGRISQTTDFETRRLRQDGSGDGEVGLKWVLARERPGRPQVAVLISSSVPIGGSDFSSERYDPSLRVLLAHALSDRVSLGYNAGVEWASEPASGGGFDTRSTWIYTTAAGFALTDKVGAFAELFGELPGGGAPDAHSLDGGFTFLVRPRLQLDIAAGVGLNDAAPDSFVGIGVSFRHPH